MNDHADKALRMFSRKVQAPLHPKGLFSGILVADFVWFSLPTDDLEYDGTVPCPITVIQKADVRSFVQHALHEFIFTIYDVFVVTDS